MAHTMVTFKGKNFNIDLEKLKFVMRYLENNEDFVFKNDDEAVEYLKKHRLLDEVFLRGIE